MTNRKRGTRTLASYVPVVTAVVGITLVIGAVVLIYGPNDISRLVVATVGLAILITGLWFAAHPFFKSSRRFIALRREVEEFIELVKLLNEQVVETAEPENVAQTTAKMHEAVERMAAEADKTS